MRSCAWRNLKQMGEFFIDIKNLEIFFISLARYLSVK